MYVTNITNDYDNDNTTDTNNCNIDIDIPALLFTSLSEVSFLCLISLMVYTIIRPLIRKKIILY